MMPLAYLFRAAVAVRNGLYDRRLLRARRLAGPVISVGNLSVGGSGKTPFVILLGELLKARGVKFNVLTRGYLRSSKGIALVDPNGDARQFGDEPLLVARKLQVPVIVGADRYRAGLWAEQQFGPVLHLLDDGFQHRQLARDVDIVLLAPADEHDHLLPAGNLREPLTALRRADVIVLTPGASTYGLPIGLKTIWDIARGVRLPQVPPRPLAFCGLARPERFFTDLRQAGLELAGEMAFRDHHAYGDADITALLERQRQTGASGFITTEKDALNLGAALERLRPVTVVPVTMELLDASVAIDWLLRKIEKHDPTRA